MNLKKDIKELNAMHVPVLTIAIPTYNRADYLKTCLVQLQSEIRTVDPSLVQIIVSDNASPDDTVSVVQQVINNGFLVDYVKNSENIGSDANIAQCFNLAAGRYVLILGDDDVLIDNSLSFLLRSLQRDDYGMVCLRSYGFDSDFRKELPPSADSEIEYHSLGDYLAKVAHMVTLISGCVINKSLLTEVNAHTFRGQNLVQVHLCLMAASRAKHNLYIHRYSIAVKRNNSGGYDHSRVFVTYLLNILDGFVGHGLHGRDIRRIERRLLINYFPYYLYKLRLKGGDLVEAQRNFSKRFTGRWLYSVWTKPVLYWPRWIAITWAFLTTVIGRSITGDFLRGLYFAISKFVKHLSLFKSSQ